MKVGLKKQYDEGILLIKNMKKLFKFVFIDFKPASKWGVFAKRLWFLTTNPIKTGGKNNTLFIFQ